VIGLLPLYDAGESRALDDVAMESLGIPGAVLMERAGVAAAHEMLELFPEMERAAVVCGSGNNGGDGFVVARHLHAAGIRVTALMVGQVGRLSIDARTNLEICSKLDLPVLVRPARRVLARELRSADVVVDAVFGTGFAGAPRGEGAAAIEAINAAAAPVVALDVPSGVEGSTGVVATIAVRAAYTVAFHGPKLGLLISPGRQHAGSVIVADIGIPPQVESPTRAALATRDLLDLVPRKGASATKYRSGAVLVVGGAPGFAGAPLLCGRAALRAGGGIVWLAVVPELAPTVAAAAPELIVRPLPDGLDFRERAGAVALGPGLGRTDESVALARRVIRLQRGPLVVDADGLWALGDEPERMARRRVPAVLTPHEGEMGRLLGRDAGWVAANRLAAVREAAARSGCVVLLKGADTLVADAGGERLVVSSSHAHGLATAGTGDVLTGVIAALLAKGLDPLTAACCGAVMHAAAGAEAAERIGPDGIVASDVVEALPGVMRR